MTLKQVATAFDMKVKDFAKMLGFSRQAFYAGKVGYIRGHAAVEHLHLLNRKMYQDEQTEARRRFYARSEAIMAFERMMKDGDGK